MIAQIEARNYRSLRLIRQPLPRFAALTGPNGSGKSTLLDVPSLLADVVRDREGVSAAVAARAQDIADLAWLRQGAAVELALEARVPADQGRQAAAGRVRYEVSVGRKGPGAEVGLLAETLWLRPEPGAGEADTAPTLFPLPEPPEEAVVCPPGYPTPAGWRRVVHKVPNSGNDYFRSELSDWNNTFRLGPHRSALANLPEDEDNFPTAVWFRRLLLRGIHRLVLDLAALRRPSLPGAAPRLEMDGGNLPAVVDALVQQNPGQLGEWMAHLRMALPDLKEVHTAVQGDGRRGLRLGYANGVEVAAEQAAEGVLRLLALTAPAYGPGVDGVWVVEAPERGLDLPGVSLAVQALQAMSGAQVMVTTYSSQFIEQVDPGCVLCFGRDENGATTVVGGARQPDAPSVGGGR